MPSIGAPRSFTARAESLARVLVQGSAVSAVVVGCLIADPLVGLVAGVTFVVAAVMACWRFESTTAIVLFLAYVNGGMMLAVPAPLTGAPLWLAAMSGLVAGGLPWTRWSAPLAWRWPLILWLLGIALSWPIIAAREIEFSLLTPRGVVGPVVITALVNFCSGLWLDAVLSWDAETIERRVARPLLASVVLSAGAVFYQTYIDVTWLSGPPWIELHRAPGLMADANPLAVALGIWAPLAIAMWRTRHHVLVGGLLTIALWSAAWLTGSRTFLLQLCAGIVGVTKGALSGLARKRLLVIVLTGTIALTGTVAFVPMQIFNRGPVARLIYNFPTRQAWVIFYEAFWYRGGYGVSAVELIRRHPWSGVGVGAFNDLQGDYHPQGLIAPDNAQNLWRHALAERGILAFIAVVALTLRTCGMLLRRTQAPPLLASTLKATIIGLGLALMFGVPTQNAAIAVTAASIVGWLRALDVRPQAFGGRRYAAMLLLAWGLAMAGVAVDGWKAVTDLRPAARAARKGAFYVHGFGEAQIGPDGSRGRVVFGRAVAAMAVTSPAYEVRYWTSASREARLRVWRDGSLVMDEPVRGAVGERVLEIPPRVGGVLIEFEADSPGVVVAGRFR